ncbi:MULTISPECIES: DUF4397 domain-containing protein [unclassified Mucilaginibacter]|uniref:DUF4397 domain-containing protein n=1 Tax=unclassified Mucilaginibacter TaxID=2617802 RepID=UPI002AC92E43|nr:MULTISPECIES: DUF4397 domain-containing protein [unclassified Mucilaginibacter]MEB0262403.1 DUF4397 domain-containing protein [Mucilaginibacter sp. 10I4]MEB0277940.1 DUF4397 domain-containing protein [Mucilaginibacter sp. 10B2]MEB0299707.1 DUF4397 domain-containing protein [Mucilaginibacter sp. 5C4]WPX22831.1 DUF4397 domain-containing protein [Mucilaginibacter sp. 5C4]
MMKFKIPVFIVLIGLLAAAACKKFDEAPPKIPTTYLNFINASADTLNVYVNGSRLNNISSTYPLGSSGYIQSPLGEQNYQVKRFGRGDVLFTVPIKLDSAGVYSFYAIDRTMENSFVTLDTLSTLSNKVSSIRFVHTSPKLGPVDIVLTDDSKKIIRINNRSFKTTSVFLTLKEGVENIQIYKAGTLTLLSQEERILQIGRAYTLFTKAGLSDAGVTTPATGLIINQ